MKCFLRLFEFIIIIIIRIVRLHIFNLIISLVASYRHATNDITAIVRLKVLFFILLFFSLQNELVPSLICFYVTLLHAFHLHIIRSRWWHSILCECVLNGFIQMAMDFLYPRSKLKFLRLIIYHYQTKILKSKSKPTGLKRLNCSFSRIYHRSSSSIVLISVQTFYD